MTTRRKTSSNKEYGILLVLLVVVITGLVFWNWMANHHEIMIAFGIGFGLGFIFIIWLIRWLIGKILHSKLAWAIVAGLFGYEIARKLIDKKPKVSPLNAPNDTNEPTDDNSEVVAALRQLKFKSDEIKEAISYLKEHPQKDIQNKVRSALKYLERPE